jgi:outer membrane murein-binding lipoprotein Lpp
VKSQFRSETRSVAPDQIETLVITLSQRVQLLESDIEAEEERTRCTDRRDAAYSILARTLIARRDNLSETISALRQRLGVSELERDYT